MDVRYLDREKEWKDTERNISYSEGIPIEITVEDPKTKTESNVCVLVYYSYLCEDQFVF